MTRSSPLLRAAAPAGSATDGVAPRLAELGGSFFEEVRGQRRCLLDIPGGLRALAERTFTVDDQLVDRVSRWCRKVHDRRAFSTQHHALRGLLQHELHELQRLKRDVEVGAPRVSRENRMA